MLARAVVGDDRAFVNAERWGTGYAWGLPAVVGAWGVACVLQRFSGFFAVAITDAPSHPHPPSGSYCSRFTDCQTCQFLNGKDNPRAGARSSPCHRTDHSTTLAQLYNPLSFTSWPPYLPTLIVAQDVHGLMGSALTSGQPARPSLCKGARVCTLWPTTAGT